ncbi:acyltransferase family protein [Tropicimonas sp. S265A]|uniref:acyltransferase family protein n=1 Tax=Tropicimonas sp. S265A TaxID=3415134 RepID=UPI003C7B7BA9
MPSVLGFVMMAVLTTPDISFSDAPRQRLDWLDMAKGLAIFLVVVGHTNRGLMSAGILGSDGPWAWIDSAIYSFHMPFFFALSGYVVGYAPGSGSIGQQIATRVWRLAVPMVIWTYMFLILKASAGQATNTPVAWEEVARLPLPPVLHMWFLWALIVLSVVWILLKACANRFAVSDLKLALVLIAIGVFLRHGGVPLPPGWAPYCSGTLQNAAFFFLGIALAQSNMLRVPMGIPGVALALSLSIPLCWQVWSDLSFLSSIILIILLWSLCISAKTVAPYLAPLFLGQALLTFGKASLAIFVAHTVFSAAMRIVLMGFGIESAALHMILGLGIGIAGPIVLLLAAYRAGVARKLGLA